MLDTKIEITIRNRSMFSIESDSPIVDDIYKLVDTDVFEWASITEYQILNNCVKSEYYFESIGAEGVEAIKKIISLQPDKDIVFIVYGTKTCHEFSKESILKCFDGLNIRDKLIGSR